MKRELNINESLMRVDQAAKLLAISTSHFWRLIRDGKVPRPIKLSPKISVWRSSDIQRFVNKPELLRVGGGK